MKPHQHHPDVVAQNGAAPGWHVPYRHPEAPRASEVWPRHMRQPDVVLQHKSSVFNRRIFISIKPSSFSIEESSFLDRKLTSEYSPGLSRSFSTSCHHFQKKRAKRIVFHGRSTEKIITFNRNASFFMENPLKNQMF